MSDYDKFTKTPSVKRAMELLREYSVARDNN
jgi:hypothetical protein